LRVRPGGRHIIGPRVPRRAALRRRNEPALVTAISVGALETPSPTLREEPGEQRSPAAISRRSGTGLRLHAATPRRPWRTRSWRSAAVESQALNDTPSSPAASRRRSRRHRRGDGTLGDHADGNTGSTTTAARRSCHRGRKHQRRPEAPWASGPAADPSLHSRNQVAGTGSTMSIPIPRRIQTSRPIGALVAPARMLRWLLRRRADL